MLKKTFLDRLLIIMLLIFSVEGFADFQFTFNGHTYLVVTTGASWPDASAAAKTKMVTDKQGYLATIDGLSENTEIFNQLEANIPPEDFSNTRATDGGETAYVWIGANDIANEASWVWDKDQTQFWQGDRNGKAVNGLFNNWGKEPDDFFGQDAAGMGLTAWPRIGGTLGNKSEWNDVRRTNLLYYIVEFDAVGDIVSADPFQVNAGLNDAWFDPFTNGQGFFITVFPDLGLISLAWFTYDTELPPEEASANPGDAGHRWLTALGMIDGDKSIMDITVSSGGVFDTASDIEHMDDGTIVLTFENCNSGTVEYSIPSIGRQGTVPIQRVAQDNVTLCEALLLAE